MVSILIVDDHLLMRRAVREVVEKEEDLQVVAEASNGAEAEAQAAQVQPDVVLMDLDMPDCDGFQATERVLACSPQSRVIIFTASHKDQHVFQALQRGAMGYITKDIEPESLVHAIRCAARNDLCIPGSLATQILAHLRAAWQSQALFSRGAPGGISYRLSRRAASLQQVPAAVESESDQADGQAVLASPALASTPPIRPLTLREREILDLMRKGRKNREIAGELCIAESTVHKHVQNIFEKLHARNRTEAIYLTSADG
ncbi:MAG: response regulator transcription factor [Ktedonobacteraceae bacterium]|nr:response regulator transcription factor [Ktedonobacteraceae bacterium]